MSDPSRLHRTDAATLVRHGLVALTAIGIFAAAFELATERHWNGIEQMIPWIALVVLAVAVGLLFVPDGGGITAARVLAVLVLGASVYGVLDHIAGQLRVRRARPALRRELGHAACSAAVVVGRDEDGGPGPDLGTWRSRAVGASAASRLRRANAAPCGGGADSTLKRTPSRYGGVRGRRCRARRRGVDRCVRGRRGCGSRRIGAGRCWPGSRGRSRSAASRARRCRRR